MEARQATLIERLKSVPVDARLIYEHDQFNCQSIPVGTLCSEAAAAIEQALGPGEPAAYTFTRRRLDGYKTRHFLWADDYKKSPGDLKFEIGRAHV